MPGPDDWKEVLATARRSRVCRVLGSGTGGGPPDDQTPLPDGVLAS